ncbi:hypothetical protein PMZ80_005924 [Knufia obscura]|uniref:F-box domain-containing protein n=2 Tax=Knufia TaxID=430999 RepID=A0AAN8EFP4_9EURO|nr:hypothetical protein PMZ80_005924 [Knufia obscura]KAK5954594.1 hypothetical protein OHC33_004316 [Knufia fluminis]
MANIDSLPAELLHLVMQHLDLNHDSRFFMRAGSARKSLGLRYLRPIDKDTDMSIFDAMRVCRVWRDIAVETTLKMTGDWEVNHPSKEGLGRRVQVALAIENSIRQKKKQQQSYYKTLKWFEETQRNELYISDQKMPAYLAYERHLARWRSKMNESGVTEPVFGAGWTRLRIASCFFWVMVILCILTATVWLALS